MKARLVVYSSLVVLAACSSSGGTDTGSGGVSATGGTAAQTGGAANPSGGTGHGGTIGSPGGTSPTGGGNGGQLGGGGNPVGNGGTTNTAGNGGAANNTGGADNGGAATGGSGGTISIPTGHATCTGAALPTLGTELIATVNTPMFEISDPNDASKLFICERAGNLLLKVGAADPVEVLAVPDVETGGERGLLSMAFHPNYGVGDERRFYLAFAGRGGNTVSIYEYAMSATTPDTVDMTSEVLVRSADHGANNHNGGMIAFGPDGYLYWSVGDGGNQCDGQGSAQDLTDKLGSIARIDVDNPSTPPAGNVTGAGNDTDIFHWGMRNPYRISFDMGTGDLYIGDVGQNDWEEISLAPMGAAGTNFGWPVNEGTHDCGCCNTNKMLQPAGSQAVPPIWEYQHQGGSSIIGGYVYRGSLIPGLVGRYIYADYDRNKQWVITFDGTTACENTDVTSQLGGLQNVSGFGQDANGEIYVNSLQGGVYHIIAM